MKVGNAIAASVRTRWVISPRSSGISACPSSADGSAPIRRANATSAAATSPSATPDAATGRLTATADTIPAGAPASMNARCR